MLTTISADPHITSKIKDRQRPVSSNQLPEQLCSECMLLSLLLLLFLLHVDIVRMLSFEVALKSLLSMDCTRSRISTLTVHQPSHPAHSAPPTVHRQADGFSQHVEECQPDWLMAIYSNRQSHCSASSASASALGRWNCIPLLHICTLFYHRSVAFLFFAIFALLFALLYIILFCQFIHIKCVFLAIC